MYIFAAFYKKFLLLKFQEHKSKKLSAQDRRHVRFHKACIWQLFKTDFHNDALIIKWLSNPEIPDYLPIRKKIMSEKTTWQELKMFQMMKNTFCLKVFWGEGTEKSRWKGEILE